MTITKVKMIVKSFKLINPSARLKAGYALNAVLCRIVPRINANLLSDWNCNRNLTPESVLTRSKDLYLELVSELG